MTFYLVSYIETSAAEVDVYKQFRVLPTKEEARKQLQDWSTEFEEGMITAHTDYKCMVCNEDHMEYLWGGLDANNLEISISEVYLDRVD